MHDEATLKGMRKLLDELAGGSNEKDSWVNAIDIEGYTNELLQISNNGEMKMTRLFAFISEDDEDAETMDVSITSTNPKKEFPWFDMLLDKKIRIRVDVLQ
jgi:hypothetical protein